MSFSTDTEMLEVRCLLTAPVAGNDSNTVVHDHTLTTYSMDSVLTNDSGDYDEFFMPLPLTAVLYSDVSHGSLTLNSNGTYSYTPTAHYAGSDSFTYRAYDGTLYSSPATVSLTVSNIAPAPTDDEYAIYKDSMSINSTSGVLSFDYDGDSDALTVTPVTTTSHGSLTLNSNGSFTYTPTANYFGTDSFVYAASDGVTSTNATVTLNVTNPFGPQTNTPNTPFNDYSSVGVFNASPLTGGVQVGFGMAEDHTLVYSSLAADVNPIIIVEANIQGGGMGSIPTPDSVRVDLAFGGLTNSTLYFTNNGLSMGATSVRFAEEIDAHTLTTGHYQYQMTVTSYYSGTTATRTYTGYQDIVNRQASDFGKGWSLAEQDGLAVQAAGVLWYGGAGGTAWFASNGSGGYTSPAGPLNSSTLTVSSGTYTLTDKFGNLQTFNSSGQLTSRVDINSNATTYTYSSGKLSTITDPWSRTTNFTYTSGLLSSVTDIAGHVTSLAYSSGMLTSITAPDPDGGGALAAPITSYAYTGNLLTTITDPLTYATTLAYSYGNRLESVTFADSNTAGMAPDEMTGLVDPTGGLGASAMNAADLYLPGATIMCVMTDSMSHTSAFKFTSFGGVTSYTDPLGFVTTSTYNANGQMTQMTQPIPGAGISAPVTAYTYDAHGNLTRITYPDTSYETWTYHSTLNTPLTHTDQRGKTTTYTYDSVGNLLTVTDALSNVTTLAYGSYGRLSSVTDPDPDAGGALTSPVTSFTWDSYNRITRVTNPDATHRDFTYDTANNVLTVTNELGWVTTATYDALNRLKTITEPDPDGGGALTSPVTTYTYNVLSQLTAVTDPLGYVTAYAYNSRGWLTGETLPDPDGAGGLSSPVIAYAYDANGKTTTRTDALGYVTTWAYDSDGRVTSITAPDPDGGGALTSSVTTYAYDNISRVTGVTDPNNHTTHYAYNSLNQMTSMTDALSKVTSYTYDALGNVLTVTTPDPDGGGALAAAVTTYTYTDVGQLATAATALGWVTAYAYDHDGRLLTVTEPDPDGAGGLSSPVTTYAYNSVSLVTKVTDPLGNETDYAYDAAGELLTVTAPDPDAGGALARPVTTYTYDRLGRVITVTDPLSHTMQYVYDANSQITKVTNGTGHFTTYAYDHLGRVTSRTDPDPDAGGALTAPVTSYIYDANSQITSVTDPLGNVTSYAYDFAGRMTTITAPDPDAGGALTSPVTSYVYDAAGNVTKVTDPKGYFTQYAYDANNQLTSVTQPDPDGAGALTSPVTSYTYDYAGRVITITDPNSHTTQYAYDADNRITKVTDGLGYFTVYAYDRLARLTSRTDPDPDGGGALTSPVTSLTYDANSQVTAVTDPRGNSTTYAYDHDGRVTSVTQPDPDGGGALTSPVTSYAYDAASNITRVTDPLGNHTDFTYNNDNQILTVTQPDPDGAGGASTPVWTYTYDGIGRLTQISDPLSHTTTYAYAADSRLSSTTDSLNNVTTYARDHLGRVTSVTQPDPDGGGALTSPVITYVYDANSRLTSVTDPLSHATTFGYDNIGRLTSQTDAASHTTSFAYDAVGNRTSVTDALTYVTAFAYNANNWLTSVTAPDPDGGGALTSPVTGYGYDHLGRLLTVTDPTSAVTTYAYDANGNLTSLTDSVSNVTTYAYDTLNRVTSETDAASHSKSYVYDAKSQLTSRTDRNNRVTTYDYDNLGRRIEEQWIASGSPIYTATYEYDAVGQLTSASDGNSAYAMTYNANGRVTQIDNNGTPTGPTVVLDLTYDNLSRLTSQAATVSSTDDFLNSYTYNAASQLTKITQQSQSGGNSVASKRIDLTYTTTGQLSTVDRYANLAGSQLVATSTWGYDAKGQATSLTDAQGATTLASYTWSYDRIGRLTGDSINSVADTFTYDASGQITAVTHNGSGTEAYSYDANGNRTGGGHTTTTNNQLTSDGTYNYTYDNEGNLTRKTTISGGAYVTYTWDYHNRLTDVKAYNVSDVLQSHIHYTYDVFNRLIEKQVDPTGGGTFTATQDFVYDLYGNMVLIYDGTGARTDRMLNGLGLNQILADESGAGVVSWYLTDRAGTVNDVVRYNSGTGVTSIANHLTYHSFGNITAQSNSANQPLFAYTGQMWDADAGLYYYHARWYDARTGRFLSQDPLSFAAGDSSLYRYVRNSPVNFSDPKGLQQANYFQKTMLLDLSDTTWNTWVYWALAPDIFYSTTPPVMSKAEFDLLVPAVRPPTSVQVWKDTSSTLQYWQSFGNMSTNPWNATNLVNPWSSQNFVAATAISIWGVTTELIPGGMTAGTADALSIINTYGASGSPEATVIAPVAYGMTFLAAVSSYVTYAGAVGILTSRPIGLVAQYFPMTGYAAIGVGTGNVIVQTHHQVTTGYVSPQTVGNALMLGFAAHHAGVTNPNNWTNPFVTPTVLNGRIVPFAGINHGKPFPLNAQPGILNNVNPNTLTTAARTLQTGNLKLQLTLLKNGTQRWTPILVTPQGVVLDGNHGVAAAIIMGRAVDITVVPHSVPLSTPFDTVLIVPGLKQ